MKPTLYEPIIKEYEAIGDWEFAGKVSNKLSYELKKKASNLERRMRELHQEGILESRLIKIGGIPNKVVCYRIKQSDVPAYAIPLPKVAVVDMQKLF